MRRRMEFRDCVAFRVLLDDVTIARLMELADMCHQQPATLIASIVATVLEEDALAHSGGAANELITLH